MIRNYKNIKEYNDSWYSVTANRLIVTLGPLKEEVNCDVCVIGGGFTGLSAAVELAQAGLSVVVLEKNSIAAGASGKNGGQLIRGYSQSPGYMIDKFGLEDAKFFNNLSLEGLGLMLERIHKYEVDCDLKFGHLTTALQDKHLSGFRHEIADWQKLGHNDLQIFDKKKTQDIVKTDKYIGGLFDPKGAHFHPLNYALGLADAVTKLGGRIYDHCEALELIPGPIPRIVTEHGSINARFVILGGAVRAKGAEKKLNKTSLNVTAHMIATEPLGETRARNLIAKDYAVADANFIMNYFRISNDYRLLFGGNCNYSDMDYPGEDQRLRNRMLKIFPGLRMTAIEHCWHGPLNITINRLPDIGRLSPQIYYAHGFGGHGVITANIAGKVIAEALLGTAARFDAFAKIKHAPFTGGDMLKRPLFVLGMMWYRLKDLL